MDVNINEPIFDSNARKDLPIQSGPDLPAHHPGNFWGRKFTIIVLLGILLAAVVVSYVFIRNSKNDDPVSDKVTITFSGPQQLASGNEAEYVITYNNGENADLVGLTLEVFYPDNFTFRSAEPAPRVSSGQSFNLPVLRQGQQGEVTVRGKLTGRVGDRKQFRAKLNYSLSNFSSEFYVEQTHSTEVLSPNLVLEITGPIDVTNGQDTTFSVNYSNVSGQEYDNVAIQLQYPAGFKYAQSNPPPSRGDNIWTLGKLAVDAKGKIDISGSFIGDPNQEKLVIAELGMNIANNFAPQVSSSVAFKIVPSSLSITQTANPADFTTLGRNIDYRLRYSNFGSVGMTNVVIAVTLEGPAIDMTTLRSNDGIVTGNTITWKSATLSNLALVSPNQEGTISFSIPIKSTLSTNIKNQVVKVRASILSDQVTNPVKAQELEVKIASNLGLIVSGKYVSGALPMQVGQPTTFAITFLLTNFSNDLEDVELIASLQLADSAWKNVVTPESERENMTFDLNANKIRWKPGALPAFTGKFSEARTVTFDLEVTPSQANQGQTILLLKDIQASGRDTFVNQTIQSPNVTNYSTRDLDDDNVQASGDTVQ